MKLKSLIFFLIFSFSSWSIADEIRDNKLLIGTIDAFYQAQEFGILRQEIKVFLIDTGIDCENANCYETYDFALELLFGLTDEQIPYRLL